MYGGTHNNDAIALKTSFRNMYEQNTSVLKGGGASLVVQCRRHVRQKKVYCRVGLRYSTWGEVRASTDTLVGQCSFHELLGWGEVVPQGFSY